MKLEINHKENIQFFVYYLFKGTLTEDLIAFNPTYVETFKKDRKTLLSCFNIFARNYQKCEYHDLKREISRYLIESKEVEVKSVEIRSVDLNHMNFFAEIAKMFCYNDFPVPLKNDYLEELEYNGSDPVSIFALWTNVVELDDQGNVINREHVIKRVNERLLMWEGFKPQIQFEDWELEQAVW